MMENMIIMPQDTVYEKIPVNPIKFDGRRFQTYSVF